MWSVQYITKSHTAGNFQIMPSAEQIIMQSFPDHKVPGRDFMIDRLVGAKKAIRMVADPICSKGQGLEGSVKRFKLRP